VSTAVSLENVTKVFRLEPRGPRGLKALVLDPRSLFRPAPRRVFCALDRVSLSLARGETLGVIGANGAGKSTLLALIGGILRPTSGSVRVAGRVAPLLELGAGFSHELTGRENAIVNGLLLGRRRRDVDRSLDAVIEFAGIEEFIDEPLKSYSSGMRARLGFAIAVQAHPDVLLVDEVLSVGDAAFRARSLDRIAEMSRAGATILFVTHDLELVSRVSDRVAWLDRGALAALGPPAEVVASYRAEARVRPRAESALFVLARERAANAESA